MSGSVEAAVEITDLCKSFDRRTALDRVGMRVAPGEMVALIGPSGSGKSTLLRHISGLVPADRNGGEVRVLGRSVQSGGRVARDVRRTRSRIGFVFQQFNLVGRLTLLTNTLAGMLARVPTWRSAAHCFTATEKREALRALERVGIAEHAAQRASTLSGGQQQRGAIARTMVQRAEVILGDEPIASHDPESSHRVLAALSALNRDDGVTVLVSLHQIDYAWRYCPRSVALKAGRVVFDGPTRDLTPDLLQRVYGSCVSWCDVDGDATVPHAAAMPHGRCRTGAEPGGGLPQFVPGQIEPERAQCAV
jgi:phosphonate transport system ATP-binding protein